MNDLDPRGVATNAAGTTEWVVDANKNVYVYSTSGTLLGSWSAGGLSSSAQLTGITTNGTDIWLVDSYADKVYKYTGAASRLSGSQNAASSFSPRQRQQRRHQSPGSRDRRHVDLGRGRHRAQGLQVHALRLVARAAGRIDPANTHPTGITIDPTNVSNIWIVDNGTDKVYQYTAAASRTSGSQNAAATFALAPGDTNPQGIADPPPSDMLVTPTASALALTQPSVPAVNAAASSPAPIAAALPSMAGRDAVFAMLAPASFQSSDTPSTDLMAGGHAACSPADPAHAGDQPVARLRG